MKTLVAVLIGIGIGFALGHFVAKPQFSVVTLKGPLVLSYGTKDICTLPQSTPLISDRPADIATDLGWWAYLPIYVGGRTDLETVATITPRRASLDVFTVGVGGKPAAVASPQMQQSPGAH
jgi:hypothetical protein